MPARFLSLLRVIEVLGITELVYPPLLQHDMIVGRLSQEGGLGASNTSVFESNTLTVPPQLGIHFSLGPLTVGATREAQYNARAIELLNAGANDPAFFAPLFPPTYGMRAETAPSAPAALRGEAPIGLVVTNPAPGSMLAPGEKFIVTVEPIEGFTPSRVLFVTLGDAQIVEEAPFSVMLTAPPETLGEIDLRVLGADGQGQFFRAAPLTLQVQTDQPLFSITAAPQTLYIFDDDPRRPISVSGLFLDGVERDITASSLGTMYESADPSIATVDAEGLVTGRGPGETVVAVMNGELETFVTVHLIGEFPACPVDFNGDGRVNAQDLGILLGFWGVCPEEPDPCPADTNGDGRVNAQDLGALLGYWGTSCP